MNDITAIIAAAKRHRTWFSIGPDQPWSFEDSGAWHAVHDHATAMAEALDKISRRVVPMGSRDEYRRGYLDALDVTRDIARECLDRIVKEAKP